MALKLYGGTDSNTPLEFMVRADNLEEAQKGAEFLQEQLRVSGFLVLDDFDPPVRLDAPLKRDPFPTPGIVNGGIVEIPSDPFAVYKALRLDGVDGSDASTPSTASNTLSSDFQVIAWIQFLNYEGAGEQVIMSQWSPDDNRINWRLLMNDDSLQFDVSPDGTNIFTVTA